jgi:hypothetical protein
MNLFNNTANTFAQQVEKLNQVKNRLLAEVKGYPKGTWVIKRSKNTYYQFVSANEHEVTLFRKGTENKISFFEFTKQFIVANESQVEQHEAFLRSQIIYPVQGYKVEHKNTYMDPKNCEFYMVTCRGVHGSKVRHATIEQARAEAKRVARKENHPAWVVGVVERVNP